MVVQKYGLSNWNEEIPAVKGGAPGGNQKRDEFMRLQDGSNVIRIVTQPHQYYAHKYKEENEQGFGDKIMCSAPAHKSCPLCDGLGGKKDRPKRRWLVGVIDRKTQTYKILDISYTVYQAIQNYNKEEDYGNPVNYDVDIKVNRQGGATGYYGVVPKLPRPLSEADVALVSSIDRDALARRCNPPTPEAVLTRWNTLREKKGLPAIEADVRSSVTTETSTKAVPVDMGNSEDFDFSMADAN